MKWRLAGVLVAGAAALGVCRAPMVLAAQRVAFGAAAAKRHTGATGGSGAVAPASGAPAGTGATQAQAATDAVKPGNGNVESANTALRGAEANAALLAQIAKLPPLTGVSLDAKKESGEILAHLNAVLRFYRTATAPVQKVGEPSDVLYAEQSQSEATQIAVLAFQAAKNEAALINRVPGAEAAQAAVSGAGAASQQSESQRLAAIRAQAQAQLADLQQQQAALTAQMARASGDQRAGLEARQEQLQGDADLQQAMLKALARMTSFSAQQVEKGLAGDIDRLEHSAPELLSIPVKTPAPPVLKSFLASEDAGVSTQAGVLFQLIGSLRTIDQQTKAIDVLTQQMNEERSPFLAMLRSTLAQGQTLTQQSLNPQATPALNAGASVSTKQQFADLTTTFEVLANATMPLSQEEVLLDNARGTLTTWRATIDSEYRDILRHLMLRVALITAALLILAFVNRLASQLAVRYVSDLRRRRQLLLIRRIVIGFLTGLVLIFGFVTQFSSLATFAGFISAGIAVGLQTILLSVAAYFFIVGRYGVKVGDRITVAGVTGEVIEVGLARFYLMELVMAGTDLQSTGRVAVFANSVLFQTGTPIYKQIPGTEYAWHELTAKLNSGADVKAGSEAVLGVVNEVYASYRERIQAQHQQVESWMGTALPAPQVQSRLQLVEGGLHFAVLFPVEIDRAAEVDQQIAEKLVEGMKGEGALKAGLVELPVIKAAVKS